MRAKIIKAFLAVVASFLISGAFLLAMNAIIISRYQRAADDLVSEYQLTKDTSNLVSSLFDLIQYSNDTERVASFKRNLNELQALLSKLDKNLANSDSWAVYLGARNTVNVVVGIVNKGFDDISVGNFSEVTATYLKAVDNSEFVKENTGSLLLKELESVEKAQAALAKVRFWGDLIGIALFLVVAIGSVAYAVSFSRAIIEQASRTPEARKKSLGEDDETGPTR